MAAGRAGELGAKVLVVEKNQTLGKKLLISGGGRCNFTNAETDVRTLAGHYGDARQALLSPFSKFSSVAAMEWFADRGMPCHVEENNRAFPADNRSQSVLKALVENCEKNNVEFRLGADVAGIHWTKPGDSGERSVEGIRVGRSELVARSYMLATGGTSRPETGSTGDGFRWLVEGGLKVRYPEPSLVPVAVKEPWIADLSGLAFQDIGLAAVHQNGVLETRRGKALFTHFGLSGPMVLNFATSLARWRTKTARTGDLVLSLDFFPDDDLRSLDKRLVELFQLQSGKKLRNALGTTIAPRLVPRIFALSGVDPDKVLAQVTKADRESLVQTLKGFRLTFKKLMDESRAIVSSGGLSIDEVDFRTMRCKQIPNLAVAGDILDINRPSGGYSLQLCWSTGWVAGSSVLS